MQFFEGEENFSWRVLGVESFVIMLSVLLGFTLNGWRQSSSELETVEAALRSIAAEVHYNEQRLENLLPYYRAMRDTLQHLLAVKGGDTPIEIDTLSAFRGWKIPLLRASAFQTARSTGALSQTDFDFANMVFRLYNIQDFYTEFTDALTKPILMSRFKFVEQWSKAFAGLANNGEGLYRRYNELLNTLREEHGIDVEQNTSADSTRAEP